MESDSGLDGQLLLLQDFSEAVIVLDGEGFIQFVNPAAIDLTGYSFKELAHKPLDIFYGREGDSIKAEYELSIARKKGRQITEGWRYRKDGSQFWGELTLCAVKNPDQGLKGYTCMLRDISERKNVEWQLRQSEAMHRLMVESVKDYAIFLLDTTGHIVTWNEGAKRIKGYSANEIIGRHFSSFYTREDLESDKPGRELQIAERTGKYEEEGWRVRKNGSVFWANIVITALFDEQNKLVGFSKVTRDLTDRKTHDEELRQNEERYRSLVEQIADYAIFLLDEKGRIVSWNEGARRIKGYSAEEIIGKNFSIFCPEEDILNGKPAYELRIAKEKGRYEEEGWRVRKDGSLFWANVVITSVYNADGTHVGFSKITRDLTERKESERALRESHDRYRKLAVALQATNEELSYANQELEQFTSIASHDLQEPIRTIKSFLQLIDMQLNKEQYPENLKSYVNKALQASSRMRALIQNLLYYSQLGKSDLVEEDISVDELLGKALQNMRSSLDAANASVTIDNKVPVLRGDPVQLLQLMQNLLSNAIKFTEKDKPRVHVSAAMENGHVRFAVSDNGIGIAGADLEKVFEIFRRLNTKSDYPGTGVGLAICKKIVDRHRGRIWPESSLGVGTTFYFTLNEKSTVGFA